MHSAHLRREATPMSNTTLHAQHNNEFPEAISTLHKRKKASTQYKTSHFVHFEEPHTILINFSQTHKQNYITFLLIFFFFSNLPFFLNLGLHCTIYMYIHVYNINLMQDSQLIHHNVGPGAPKHVQTSSNQTIQLHTLQTLCSDN